MAGQSALAGQGVMSTPIFDELLREMSDAGDAAPEEKAESPAAAAPPGSAEAARAAGRRRRPE